MTLLLRMRYSSVPLYKHAMERFKDDSADAAEFLGLQRQTFQAWHRGKKLSYVDADKHACRLGLHPCVLWGSDWFTEDPYRKEKECQKRKRFSQRRQELKATL